MTTALNHGNAKKSSAGLILVDAREPRGSRRVFAFLCLRPLNSPRPYLRLSAFNSAPLRPLAIWCSSGLLDVDDTLDSPGASADFSVVEVELVSGKDGDGHGTGPFGD